MTVPREPIDMQNAERAPRLRRTAPMARSVARPDSETLERLHHGEQLTIAHLAARFGVAAQTVHAAEQRPAPAA